LARHVQVEREYGLGQITDKGADTILLWNPAFLRLNSARWCSRQEYCDKGYLNLPDDAAAMLRGALAIEAKSDCPACNAGVDLTTAGFSVKLFANTLLASCRAGCANSFQCNGRNPRAVSSYEDLWRITIANYHAGPGCVSYAVYAAWAANGREVLWDEVKEQFTEACLGVVPYVDKITRYESINEVYYRAFTSSRNRATLLQKYAG